METWGYVKKYMYPMTRVEVAEVKELRDNEMVEEVSEVIGVGEGTVILLLSGWKIAVMRYQQTSGEIKKQREVKFVDQIRGVIVRETKMFVTGSNE